MCTSVSYGAWRKREGGGGLSFPMTRKRTTFAPTGNHVHHIHNHLLASELRLGGPLTFLHFVLENINFMMFHKGMQLQSTLQLVTPYEAAEVGLAHEVSNWT